MYNSGAPSSILRIASTAAFLAALPELAIRCKDADAVVPEVSRLLKHCREESPPGG